MARDSHLIKMTLSQFNVLFYAMLIGLTVMVSVFYYLQHNEFMSTDESLSQTLEIPLFVIVAIGVLGARWIFPWMTRQIDEDLKMPEKLAKLRTAYILRLALLELPVIFAGIAFLLTGREQYFMLSIILIGYFFLFRPRADRLRDALSLTESEDLAWEEAAR
ncbi:hypothetical protein [Pontibacter sp. G13]|uniref:hypothetical protein n=1 Tax=Pontibacter sp. G13 TaxID=3074898 RepID=UPI002889DAFC|nr:hypothetical protein [Pontibacter sp. G13]WNJ15943.1 hypothetical protein RJD25_13850 [Pontibacter sp. G13]